MKKLIRVFIIVFCLFFVLMAFPDSFLVTFRDYTQKVPEVMGDATLRLAEVIDDLMGTDLTGSDPDKSLTVQDDIAPGESEAQESSSEEQGQQTGEEEKEASQNESDSTEGETESAGQSGDQKVENNESDDSADLQAAASEEETKPDIFYYYYTKISKEERLLYDAMLTLAQNFDAADPASESRLLDTNPSSEEFGESYTRAYNALMRDHPEYFWIAQMQAQYECKYYLLPSFGGKYKVVLTLSDTSGQEVSEDGTMFYQEEQTRMEQAAGEMLSQVDFTQSQAGIALQLHDLLIDSAWYNTGADEYDYAHTAYGALVEDSSGNPGGALCDGYALAYEYLLQRAGLTCIVVSGYAGASEEDMEKHAWNLVKLDDDWYEVDATWDDLDFLLSPEESGYDLFLEAISDEDYMSRIRHYMFNLTTEQMRSFTPGDEFTYVSDNGWVTLLQPSVHIRTTAEESEVTRDYVTPLAPQAEGTWYTWAMLTGHE